jgi:CRISPR-associated endonuclease/helicase Cas3
LTIRALPGEVKPSEIDRLFARGIFNGEELPAEDLGGVTTPRLTLDLEPMMLGRGAAGKPSWAERMLKLRDQLGPFRIAYLEALLRAADRRASAGVVPQ